MLNKKRTVKNAFFLLTILYTKKQTMKRKLEMWRLEIHQKLHIKSLYIQVISFRVS